MNLERVKDSKARQAEILEEMKRYEEANENFHLTAKMFMKLASRARELFESTEVDEKRQLMNFVFQNLQLKNLSLSVQVQEPSNIMMNYDGYPDSWSRGDSNPWPLQCECSVLAN
ncbi:conserved hypothetical protein [Estrella lausannensis]|uniref:Uncharacterized protein n=1 Tax=Estrella lausannensis TaxID=483423 RepID=A0A0H5E5V6_9BACT|nr:conserved hypothetical protein [Estrella lausannensis]